MTAIEASDEGLDGGVVEGLEDEGEAQAFGNGAHVVRRRPPLFGEDGGLDGAILGGSLVNADATDYVVVISLAGGGGKGGMEHIQQARNIIGK